MAESCSKPVPAKREVSLTLPDFFDTLGLLVGGELPSEGPGKLSPGENGALSGAGMQLANNPVPLLAVERCEISGDVLPDSLDLGEFSGAAG